MQIVIETAAGKQGSSQNRKYYICDDTKQRVLHVTIHNVNLNDAGTCWCLIDSSWFDPRTEIELKVYKGMSKLAVLFHSIAIFLLLHLYSFFLPDHSLLIWQLLHLLNLHWSPQILLFQQQFKPSPGITNSQQVA